MLTDLSFNCTGFITFYGFIFAVFAVNTVLFTVFSIGFINFNNHFFRVADKNRRVRGSLLELLVIVSYGTLFVFKLGNNFFVILYCYFFKFLL